MLNTTTTEPSAKAETHRLRKATAILAVAIVTAIAAPASFATTGPTATTSATDNSTSTTSNTTTERKAGGGSVPWLTFNFPK